MARIITDLKTTPRHPIAHAIADPTAKSITDAKRKIRIHVICIIIAGTVSTLLFSLHIADAPVLGFGPVAPSIAQEIFDRIFRL